MSRVLDPYESPGPWIFGEESKKALATAHPRLRLLANTVILFQDIAVREGHRGREEQEAHFEADRTQVRYPNSRHNSFPSEAIHFLPVPVSWAGTHKNLARYYFLAGRVKQIARELGIEVRWGGDWDSDHDFSDQTFDDLAHWELAE